MTFTAVVTAGFLAGVAVSLYGIARFLHWLLLGLPDEDEAQGEIYYVGEDDL